MTLTKKAAAEFLGTGLLVAIVVGSGIMAERLCDNTGLALLCNTMATATGLTALILMFSGISGAHFNPVVTLTEAWRGGLPRSNVPAYLVAQFAGGMGGVALANLMFELPPLFASQHVRTGNAQYLGEFVATFGLIGVIRGVGAKRSEAAPYAVGAYIAAALWYTSSTSFANPAVTVARAFSDTFAGIRLADAPMFIAMQVAGALAASIVFNWLLSAQAVKA